MNISSSQSEPNQATSILEESVLTSQPWIKLEDLTGDLERLIGILVVPHVDCSNPLMHDDELRGECRAKLAQILRAGHLNRCASRGKAFAFVKTALQNHLRSLVQKYVFTEKRTGIKPPPRGEPSEEQYRARPTNVSTFSLDDDENRIQLGKIDPAFGVAEFLEELDHVLTQEERVVLKQLIRGRTVEANANDLGFPKGRFESLAKSIRSKAKVIMQPSVASCLSARVTDIKTVPKPKRHVVRAAEPPAKIFPRKCLAIQQPELAPRKIFRQVRTIKVSRRKGRKIHVISFRLTEAEIRLLKQRYGKFKSINQAARRIVTKVISIWEPAVERR